LLGPRYALLRDEFRVLHEQIKPRSGGVKRILVFFGGVDANNYTGIAIAALSNVDIPELHVDVVIGVQHPQREQIKDVCAQYGFICHVQTDKMAELMSKADLAIGAGGAATWERCCLGLPALVFCTADNQKAQVADAANVGLLYAPLASDTDFEFLIQRHVVTLSENRPLLRLFSKLAMLEVDGCGLQRVIDAIDIATEKQLAGGDVFVRLAKSTDAEIVWTWRNHESTRRFFFDSSSISLQSHVDWWSRSLLNSSRIILIGYSNGQPFGVVRFDVDKHTEAIISIYLNPAMTGKKMGGVLLRMGLDWIKQSHFEIDQIVAEIIPENVTSIRLFQSAGFFEKCRVFVRKV
jgi:RimJ/RimL family protein N-acetyltransferase